MLSYPARFLSCALLVGLLPAAANAAAVSYGPTPYLQTGDTPAGFFCDECPANIEDFEDNTLDPFLSIDNGSILEPFTLSGMSKPVTDSVDGDDGTVDGDGNGGHSWFTGSVRELTVTFGNAVTSAGLVFTDGDSLSSEITLEAFNGPNSLGMINAGDLADEFFTGETEEDRFLGFKDFGGITSIKLTMDAGLGIEVDHIQWQECPECVPEPASLGMGLMGCLALLGLTRRRRR